MVDAKMTEFVQSQVLRCLFPVMATPWPAASDTICGWRNSKSSYSQHSSAASWPQRHSEHINYDSSHMIWATTCAAMKSGHTLNKHGHTCGWRRRAPSRPEQHVPPCVCQTGNALHYISPSCALTNANIIAKKKKRTFEWFYCDIRDLIRFSQIGGCLLFSRKNRFRRVLTRKSNQLLLFFSFIMYRLTFTMLIESVSVIKGDIFK